MYVCSSCCKTQYNGLHGRFLRFVVGCPSNSVKKINSFYDLKFHFLLIKCVILFQKSWLLSATSGVFHTSKSGWYTCFLKLSMIHFETLYVCIHRTQSKIRKPNDRWRPRLPYRKYMQSIVATMASKIRTWISNVEKRVLTFMIKTSSESCWHGHCLAIQSIYWD